MALHHISAYTLGLAGGLSHVMQTHRIGKLTICAGCLYFDPTLYFPKLEKLNGHWLIKPTPNLNFSCSLGQVNFALLLGENLPVVVCECEIGIFPGGADSKSLRVQLHVNSGANVHRGTLEQSAVTPVNIGAAA